MLGVYNYTVILTYLGMLSGFSGILCLFSGHTEGALLCLLGAGVCDVFDGKVASTKKDRTRSEKRFGIQIDSLSDLVCFGVLPALIVCQWSKGSFLPLLASSLYLLCALIRLAWFNVDEEERQDREAGPRQTYLGLPVTLSALILPLFMGIGQLLDLSTAKAAPWLLLVMAAAFLCPFRLKKPGTTGKLTILLLGMTGFSLALMGAIL